MTGPRRSGRTSNDAHFSPGRDQLDVRITLECGHVQKARLPPVTGHVKYGCSLGLGCGYRLRWVTWVRGDMTGVNKTYAAQQEKEKEEKEMATQKCPTCQGKGFVTLIDDDNNQVTMPCPGPCGATGEILVPDPPQDNGR